MALTKYRLGTVSKWKQWSVQLNPKENELHQKMDPGIAAILKGKKICLLEKIASSFDWPDKEVFRDVAEGFGLVRMTGIFPFELNVPMMTVPQLDAQCKVMKDILWQKIGAGAFDAETWGATVLEAEEKSWLQGPFTWSQLEDMLRRFGTQQSNKLRVIDDFTENGTNAAYSSQEKLEMRTLDHLTWCATSLAKMVWFKKEVSLKLSDGSALNGPLHPGWS